MLTKTIASLIAGFVAAGVAVTAAAVPISISATLTGDPRAANPDNISIGVTITSDTTSNVATWSIALNPASHPNAKLDEFGFNMVGVAGDYTLSNFNPSDWTYSTNSTVQGSGNMAFLFVTEDGAINTGTQTLSFTMTKTSGLFTDLLFLNAPTSSSNDSALGSWQLAAHVQSLTTNGNGGTTDSGVAVGNYSRVPLPPSQIPEPGSLALGGLALALMGLGRRRKP